MIKQLLTDSLIPHAQNPRKDLGDLKELAQSIKENGVYQNLTVVDNYDGTYTIIIGHRRHAAAKLAGVKELPCAVVEMDEKTQLETMLLENMQRSDLTVYEQAQGFQLLIDLGSSVEEVAKETGFSKSTIYKRTKLLELDKDIFKESQQRNPRLEDYAKLNQLEKSESKNEALKAIGTNNFNNVLLSLKTKEKEEKNLAAVKAWLDTFATFSEKTSSYEYVRSYGAHTDLNKVSVPKDADKVKYIYDGSGPFWLYKKAKKSKKDKEKLAAEKEQQRKKELFYEKCRELDKRCRELIHDFVKNYRSKFNGEFIPLFKLFSENYLLRVEGNRLNYYLNMKAIGELYGIEVLDSYPRFIKKEDVEEVNGDLMRLILSLMYSQFSDYGFLFASSQDGTHIENETASTLYDALGICGYVLSDEEMAYINGTHEIFKIMGEGE